MGGSLFGFSWGVMLADIAGTVGASLCFALSHVIGRRFLQRCFPSRLELFAARVQAHRSSLFSFMLALRFTPVVPNWFVNIAAPLCSVPISTFAFATSIGILPQTMLAVHAGVTLHDLKTLHDVLDWRYFVSLSALGLLALLPTLPQVRSLVALPNDEDVSPAAFGAGTAGARQGSKKRA